MSSSSQQQQQQQASHHHNDGLLNTIPKISLLLAFVIGWLSQMATFAINLMAIHFVKAAREEQVTHDYKKDEIFMIEWCTILGAMLVTTSMGMVGLFYVRNLMRKYIAVTTSCTTNASDSNSNNNSLVQLLMDHVDNRLVVGYLFGVAMTLLLWEILFMGRQFNLYHFTLTVFLLFFQFEGRRMQSTLLLQDEERESKKKEEQFEYVALV